MPIPKGLFFVILTENLPLGTFHLRRRQRKTKGNRTKERFVTQSRLFTKICFCVIFSAGTAMTYNIIYNFLRLKAENTFLTSFSLRYSLRRTKIPIQ